MRVLLDTHILLWVLGDPKRLSKATLAVLRDPEHEVQVSVASLWEIAIKVGVGKLRLPGPPGDWLPEALERTGIATLGISALHALAVAALPFHHRDPFDRLLVAQALLEGLTVVTRDRRFGLYGVALLAA